MNLVVARHGSGIEVNDYRLHGGLDALSAMFALDDVPLDTALILEAVDFWEEAFSMTAAKAIARMSLDELRSLEDLLDRSIAAVGDMDAFLEAQLTIQDELARLSGSVLFRMLANSTRPVRRRIMRLLPASVDMRGSLDEMKRLLRFAVATRPGEAAIREGLLGALRNQSGGLKERFLINRDVPRAGARESRGTHGRKSNGAAEGSGRHGAGTGRAAAHRGRARRRVR
jgi:hypothetical protein